MTGKPLEWLRQDERDAYFNAWPKSVRDKFNDLLRPLQQGFKPVRVNTCKPWTGISGCHELSSGAYRLLFVWNQPTYVYVLYAFSGKDSSRGGKTRKRHANIIDERWAELQDRLNAAAGKKRH